MRARGGTGGRLPAVLVAMAAVAAVAAAVAWPAEAAGQVVFRAGPRAGLLTPAGWLYEEYAHFGVEPLEWTSTAVLRATVVGVVAEAALPAGVWVRGEVTRTVGAETWLEHAWLRPPVGFDPAVVIRARYRVPTTITLGGIELGLPTRFRLPFGVQPYVLAGAGGKRYDFDTLALDSLGARIVLPQPGTVPYLALGGGAVLDAGPVRLDLHFRDAISEYWDRQQHDVMVALGAAWRLPPTSR